MKLNILGTEYEYKEATEREDTNLCSQSGYCDGYAKIIAIKNDYNEKAPGSIKDFDSYKKETKRHELVHAYFYESGLSEYAHDEQLVDWIACQLPKMLKSFEQVDAL